MNRVNEIKEMFSTALSIKEKEEILCFCYEHRPRPHIKFSRLLGLESQKGAFDVDLVDGVAQEIAFLNIITTGKYEVKHDFKVGKTGNIAVEVECSRRPSGLAITEAPYWLYFLTGEEFQDEVAVLISTNRLRRISALYPLVPAGDRKAARVHLVPVRDLLLRNSEIYQKEQEQAADIQRSMSL